MMIVVSNPAIILSYLGDFKALIERVVLLGLHF